MKEKSEKKVPMKNIGVRLPVEVRDYILRKAREMNRSYGYIARGYILAGIALEQSRSQPKFPD